MADIIWALVAVTSFVVGTFYIILLFFSIFGTFDRAVWVRPRASWCTRRRYAGTPWFMILGWAQMFIWAVLIVAALHHVGGK
jgi:hypothetical protein